MDTHKLLVTDGNAKGREIVIGSGEFLVGRLADTDDGRLADDLELSRRHARIMRTLDGGIEIEDLGSTNGTYVNDQKVTTRRRLEPGDVIEVGQTRLSVAQQIKKGSPSTVEISTRGPGFSRGRKTTVSGGGSGIVVDAEKGLVLTNAHVVAGQTSVKAKLGDGAEVSARVVSQAPCEDLALISLRPTAEEPDRGQARHLGQGRGG